jgi:hypothetical protein
VIKCQNVLGCLESVYRFCGYRYSFPIEDIPFLIDALPPFYYACPKSKGALTQAIKFREIATDVKTNEGGENSKI